MPSGVSADPTFFILKYSAWLDASTFENRILGAVVKEYADPAGSDYLPDNPLRHYKEDGYIENTFHDFIVDKMQSAGAETTASVPSLAGIKLKGDKDDQIKLDGKLLRMKRLQRQSDFWDALKTDDVVQKRLPRWITLRTLRYPVCLVVGIMTCEDVDVEYKGGQSRETELHGKIPLAQAVAPAVAGVGDAGSLQVAGKLRDEVKTTFSGRSASRKIFALELKVVTTPFLQRKKVDLYELKKTGPRAPGGRLLGEQTKGEGTKPAGIDDLVLEELE